MRVWVAARTADASRRPENDLPGDLYHEQTCRAYSQQALGHDYQRATADVRIGQAMTAPPLTYHNQRALERPVLRHLQHDHEVVQDHCRGQVRQVHRAAAILLACLSPP